MKKTNKWPVAQAMLAAAMWAALAPAQAAVSAEEAAKLKTVLTPTGAERAGNKEGTIPEWTGGLTTPTPGFVNGGRRPDPFANEKPLFSITAQNADKHKDKLSPGTLAMLAKYPQSYRLDVYRTHRTAAMPEATYERTFRNATNTKLGTTAAGYDTIEGFIGGVPFPIPKSGLEVMWNQRAKVWPANLRIMASNYLLQSDGRRVLVSTYVNDLTRDFSGKASQDLGGTTLLVLSKTTAPAIRSGELLVSWETPDYAKSGSWVYLPGQRRVRKLPNACCDTPTPFSSGLISFDELDVYNGPLHKFDWKVVGKKEVYVPYNSNRTLVPREDEAIVMEHHLNPDHVRWELHRVWVVEAMLKAGERHPSQRSTYYLDEDNWNVVLGERYDAKGTLARTGFAAQVVMPDVPAVMSGTWGWNDLLGGTAYISNVYNASNEQLKTMPPYPSSRFQPDAMAGEGVR